MKYYFQYNPADGRVASYSEGPQICEKFEQVAVECSAEDLKNLAMNCDHWIENGKLVSVKNDRILKEEKAAELACMKEKLLCKSKPTVADIVGFLKLL